MLDVRDWTTVKHFQRAEFVKDPDRISWDVVTLLDEMREAAGCPFIIHVAWDDSGHEKNSTHYANTSDWSFAVDGHFRGWSLLDQWLFVERYPWMGIGLYPYWEHPGVHLDLRRVGLEHPHLGRRWWRDKDGTYQAFDREMLKVILTLPPAKEIG